MRYHHVFKEAVLKINECLCPNILISDPTYLLTDNGPMNGTAVRVDTLVASDNVFAFERVGAEILGVGLENIEYLAYAQNLKLVPDFSAIRLNAPLDSFCVNRYNLSRTLKDRFVRKVFENGFLTYLLYCSGVGQLIHKLYYLLTGKRKKTNYA